MNVRKLASTIELVGDTYDGRLAVAVDRCHTLAAHIVYYTSVDRNRAQRPNYTSLLHWRRGVVVSGVRRMNEVNERRARLVLG